MTQYEIDNLACSLTVSARPCPAGHERARPLVEPGPGPGATREIEPPPCPFRHADVGGDELRIDWPPALRPGTFTLVTATDEDTGAAVRVQLTYDAVRRLSGQLDALLGKPWLRSRQPEPARTEPGPTPVPRPVDLGTSDVVLTDNDGDALSLNIGDEGELYLRTSDGAWFRPGREQIIYLQALLAGWLTRGRLVDL